MHRRNRAGRGPLGGASAADQLKFIRDTMERAGSFTAVSGWGQAVVGTLGLLGAVVAARSETQGEWLAVWIVTALVAVGVAGVAILRKCARLGVPPLSRPARRFALCLTPPVFAGTVLTATFVANGLVDRLPGLWLLLYGAGVVSGGALSIRIVPVMGVCFMLIGVTALAAPPTWGNWFMAAGFGVLHLVFGVIIAVKHGG